MRKQFDLKYYLEHPETKVVTRDGRDVRILCTDLRDKYYPILATYIKLNGISDNIETFTTDGKAIINASNEHTIDLFFELPDPVKKRVPLTYEDLLERVRDRKTMWLVNDRDTVFNIVDFDFEFAYTINGDIREVVPYSYKELMDGITFVDGNKCWKEVDSCDTCTNDKGCVTCNDGDQWKGGEE